MGRYIEKLLQRSSECLTSLQLNCLIRLVFADCPNLEQLSLIETEISVQSLCGVLKTCQKIQRLDLTCLFASKGAPPEFVDCPNLHTLCVCVSPEDSMRHIMKFHSQVETFVVPLVLSIVAKADKFRAFSFRYGQFAANDYWSNMFSACVNLRTLKLQHGTFRAGSLISIATKCPHYGNASE